jgi:UDP-N-acetylmuramate dehydrogenase
MTPLTEEKIASYLARIPTATRDEPMAKHTTFRVGGNAKLHVVPASSEAMIEAVLAALDLDVPFYFYGGGSNLLVSDEGFEGVMIQSGNRKLKIDGQRITVESGVITGLVARQSVEAGLTGFEWAIGVPGTIGGAVYGNAGCYGGEMKDSIVEVDIFDLNARERRSIPKEECGFAYRESRFKHGCVLILGCTIELAKAEDIAKGKARIEEIILKRKESQPMNSSTGGSTFKNFEFTDESQLEILKRSAEIPETMLKNKVISAGWLIDQAGMLGQNVGDAEVSSKHGNFFLNKGNARAQDLLALISRVKMKVRDDLGIELQEEIQLAGF